MWEKKKTKCVSFWTFQGIKRNEICPIKFNRHTNPLKSKLLDSRCQIKPFIAEATPCNTLIEIQFVHTHYTIIQCNHTIHICQNCTQCKLALQTCVPILELKSLKSLSVKTFSCSFPSLHWQVKLVCLKGLLNLFKVSSDLTKAWWLDAQSNVNSYHVNCVTLVLLEEQHLKYIGASATCLVW